MGLFTFIAKHLPLAHAKPVLFIRDHQRQLIVLDLFLDQRMGSHDDICLVIPDFLIGQSFLPGCHGTGHQNRNFVDTMGLKQLQHTLIMLLCQHLRRHHQRPLEAIICSMKQSQDSNNRLTGTDIPLDQTVHHQTASKIPLHFI